MNHRFLNVALLFFLSILVPLQVFARKPDWVKQRPHTPEFYIGLAKVAKLGSKIDYMQEARSKALQELAGEISLTISSKSVLHQLEDQFGFVQKYESKVSASVMQTIEGYELQTWEDKKSYWVFARLSKSKYAMQKQMKLDRARMAASAHLDEAQKHLENRQPYEALLAYARALMSLKDHLQDDLQYRTANGSVDLGLAVQQGIVHVMNGFELTPLQKVYALSRTHVLQLNPGVQVLFQLPGVRYEASGVPVVFGIVSGGGIFKEKESTDRAGVVSTSFQRLNQGLKRQVLQVRLDLQPVRQLMEQEPALFEAFFGRIHTPVAEVVIELEKTLAHFTMTERLFDAFDRCETLQQDLRAVLNQNYFAFTVDPEKAKYHVVVEAEIDKGERKQGNGYEVFLVTGRLIFTIKEIGSGNDIFAHSISGIRGMQPGGYEKAVQAVCKAIFQKVHEEILPQLEQLEL